MRGGDGLAELLRDARRSSGQRAGRSRADEAARGTSGLVVVLAYHVWQNSFAGADDIVGRSLLLNGVPATIVGVAEPAFRGALFAELADLWVPLSEDTRKRLQPNRSSVDVAMIGQRNGGASIAEANAELATLWAQLQRAHPELNQKLRIRLVTLFRHRRRQQHRRDARQPDAGDLLGRHAADDRHRLRQRHQPADRAGGGASARDGGAAVARRLARADRARPARRRAGAVDRRLDRGLPLRVVGVAGGRAVPRAGRPGPVPMPDLTPDWTVVGYALGLALLCTIAVTSGRRCARAGSSCCRS